jgi:hypothetical protein
MDARIKNLVNTHSLKMNLWTKAAHQHAKPYFYADPRLDVIMVMIVDPRTPKITHFVDEHVALLYEENTREVIGFRIESFGKSFLPQYASLQMVWKFSDVSKDFTNVGDLHISARQHDIQMANELTKVARPILAKAGMEVPETPHLDRDLRCG